MKNLLIKFVNNRSKSVELADCLLEKFKFTKFHFMNLNFVLCVSILFYILIPFYVFHYYLLLLNYSVHQLT